MANPIRFQTLRRVRLASTSGHVAVLEPGAPKVLPEALHAEAYAAGCVPVDEASTGDGAGDASGEEPGDRAAQIRDAVEQLVAENDKAKFSASTGKPHVSAVEALTGFDLTAAERDTAFDAVMG